MRVRVLSATTVRLDTFRAPDVTALGRITAEEVRDLARATMGPDCDALFIGCSQLPTHAILAGLQAEFGRPTWPPFRAAYYLGLERVLPAVADRVSSNPEAYRYLGESLRDWPAQPGQKRQRG